MIVLFASIFAVLIAAILFKYIKCGYGSVPGIFEYPGGLPLIGHLHLFFGGSVHIYNMLVKTMSSALKNDGYVSYYLGPFRYIGLTDPADVLKVLYNNPDKHYFYSFMKPWLGNGLITSDYKTWQHHRKLLSPMFGMQYLDSYMGIFNKQARKMVDRLRLHIGKGDFDHEPMALITNLETICQTAVGANVGEQMTNNKAYIKAAVGMMSVILKRSLFCWYHPQVIFNWSFLRKEQDECLKVIEPISNQLLSKRRAQYDRDLKYAPGHTDESRPFVDYLLKTEIENADFTDQDVLDHINTLIVGGYETTATAVVYCLMFLGHYKNVQQKAYNEIQEIFEDSDRDVEKNDFSKLIYIDAVIKESLRICPIVPIILRTLASDIKLRKCELKAGTHISISLLGINRHPEWGPDADEFRPERWLDGTLPKNPNLWAPFGLGKRYCVGKTYAMMSIKTTIVHVLRRYQISSDVSKLVLKMEIVAKPASGQYIRVEERKKHVEENDL